MRAPMVFRLLLALGLFVSTGFPSLGQTPAPARAGDRVAVFLEHVRDLAIKGDGPALTALAASGTSTEEFVRAMTPAAHRAGDQGTRSCGLPGGGIRLLLEMFSMRAAEARVFTWQMDVTGDVDNPADVADRAARSAGDRVRVVHLSLDLRAPVRGPQPEPQGPGSLHHSWRRGTAFVASSPDGPTAVVLLGRGRLRSPRPTRRSAPSSRSSPAPNSSPPNSTPC